jgi:hypothetical protein
MQDKPRIKSGWTSTLVAIACAVPVSILWIGCRQPGDKGNRVPVVGKVTFSDGKPLPRGTVIFIPDGGKGNTSPHEPRGVIDGEGKYKLMTTLSLEGASPGWYVVTMISQEPYDESKSSWDPPWLINRKYAGRQTSGLAVEVVDKAEPRRYDFQVTK